MLTVSHELKPNHILWRYIDFPALIGLLQQHQLFFPRADQLVESRQQVLSKNLRERMERLYVSSGEGAAEEFRTKLKQRVFLNCWYRGMPDKLLHWQAYGRGVESVAVTTTVSRLSKVLADVPHVIHLKSMRYGNVDDQAAQFTIPWSELFFYKHHAYAGEREVRLLIDAWDVPTSDQSGIGIPVDLSVLLRSVTPHPEAPAWIQTLIRDVVAATCESIPVTASKVALPCE